MRWHRKKNEKGIALIEVLVSLALLGIIATGFLSGTAMTSSARSNADEHASSKILAEGIMDNIKKQEFDVSYNVTIPSQYAAYTVNITVDDVGYTLQKITVDVSRTGKDLFSLEGYKSLR